MYIKGRHARVVAAALEGLHNRLEAGEDHGIVSAPLDPESVTSTEVMALYGDMLPATAEDAAQTYALSGRSAALSAAALDSLYTALEAGLDPMISDKVLDPETLTVLEVAKLQQACTKAASPVPSLYPGM